jgi:hypothetical protein
MDLVVVSIESSDVSIFLGDGSGGFSQAAGSPISVDQHPFQAAVADFNGDGKPDIAVACSGLNKVDILLGDGTGHFSAAPGSPITVGDNPRSLVEGDFNGDGNKDIAVGDVSDTVGNNAIWVLLGDGTGRFATAPGSPLQVDVYPYSEAVADFNGDGRPDLAIAIDGDHGDGNVTVLLGSGLGGFNPAPGSPFTVGLHPRSVTVGDFNGDGKMDLAAANAYSSDVSVLLGDGSGGFTPALGSPIAAGAGPLGIAAGDLNGDGKLDLAVADSSGPNTSVLLGDGSGGFVPATGSPFAGESYPSSVALGDFNGDGRPDMAVPNYADNDVSIYLNQGGVTITPSANIVVGEGGQVATYTVVLNNEPASDVTVNIDAGAQLATNPTSVTFTPADWNIPKTITVSAIDDFIAQGDRTATIAHSVVSADPDFNGINVVSVSVTILDNDHAGVSVDQGNGVAVTEGGATDSYAVSLTSQPTADVQILVSPDSQLTTAPTTLTFTAGDWNVPQPVTVTAVDDLIPEGLRTALITHSSTSIDPNYNNTNIQDVVVQVTDNDPGVLVVESSGSTNVTEDGATDTYTFALSTQPTADVVITVTGDAYVSGSPNQVTFTSANWYVPQTVTVTAVDDLIAEGTHSGTMTHSASSGDPKYDGIPISNVVATITDNDTAGIIVTPTSGLLTGENGRTATFTVVLASQPTATVTIPLASSNLTEGTVTPNQLVFTPADALTPKTVIVTGVDDPTIDGDIPYTVITSPSISSDPAYSGRDAADVSVTNLDDDKAAANSTVVAKEDDGDTAIWRLRGPGTLVYSQDDPNQTGVGPVRTLYVAGTDAKKSSLALKVVKAFGTGDGYTTIGGISGSSLRGISASKANLVGTGVNINGYLGGLAIRDILNEADVVALGTPEFRTTISAHDIGDGTAISLGTLLQSLTAARFGDGTISAPSMGTLNVKGDAKAGIAADFRGSLTLSGEGIVLGKAVLSSVNVRGTVIGASFRVAGTVKSFRSGQFLDSLLFVGFDPTNSANPLGGGNFTSGLKLGSFVVTGLKNSTDPAFDNSNVAASTIGTTTLKSVDPAIANTYGIVSQHIGRLAVRDSGFMFDPTLPSPQRDGSFQVWIV